MINLNELTKLVKTVFHDGEVFLILDDFHYYGTQQFDISILFELKVGFDHVRTTWRPGMSTEVLARELCNCMCGFKLENSK